MVRISVEQARRFLVAWQGLDGSLAKAPPAVGGLGAADARIMAFFERVGCIQFDPLDICGHNHELVLQARFPGFRRERLRTLLYGKRLLVDGMDKVMSIYPARDWPRLGRRRALDGHWADLRSARASELKAAVLEELRRRGPLSSLELEHHETTDWSWAPTRLARACLENLYLRGELLVHHRVHTRKYYDLAERLLPPAVHQAPDPFPSEAAYEAWHAERRIAGVGFLADRGSDAWVGLPGWNAGRRKAAIRSLLDRGELLALEIAGLPQSWYLPARALPVLEAAAVPGPSRPAMRLLAPLDNLLWDRRLVEELFGFGYRWEVYTPARQRAYGYYVLPVLWRDRLVARCEPLRDPAKKRLVVRNWWWEADWEPARLAKRERERLLAARERCLADFAAFLGLAAPQRVGDD